MVNALGNYVFVFGHFGAPALGLDGSAISSVITACAMLRVWVGGSQLETVKVVAACDIPDAAKASVAAIKRNFMGILLSDDAIQNNRRVSVDW